MSQGNPNAPDASAGRLPRDVAATLLALARARIAHAVGITSVEMPERTNTFVAPAACYVTLTVAGRLRGCFGTTEPRDSLYDAVGSMAVAAATWDRRFSPLEPADLTRIRIEISILTPLERVSSPDMIRSGIHGVCVQRGHARGLFLPQVWEHFTSKEDFLGELCSGKAGLPREAWKDPLTELFIFQVNAYEEDG